MSTEAIEVQRCLSAAVTLNTAEAGRRRLVAKFSATGHDSELAVVHYQDEHGSSSIELADLNVGERVTLFLGLETTDHQWCCAWQLHGATYTGDQTQSHQLAVSAHDITASVTVQGVLLVEDEWIKAPRQSDFELKA